MKVICGDSGVGAVQWEQRMVSIESNGMLWLSGCAIGGLAKV